MKIEKLVRALLCLMILGISLTSGALDSTGTASAEPAAAASPINHIVVLYMENRSFDGVYGSFPGANGLSNAGATATQVDMSGKAYDKLPVVTDTTKSPAAADPRFPQNMPNQPFDIAKFVPNNQTTGDLVHRYYQEQMQIDGGKMDKFAAVSDSGGLSMGYYDGSNLPMWKIAQQYTMADNFFHAAFGGSFLNHFWLVCACSPKYDNAPAATVAKLDANGNLLKDGSVTPDGYAVNTTQSIYMPHSPSITDTTKLLPPQTMKTIGDSLNDKNISWAWYSGGYNDALAGHADKLFQFHHQPFVYFKQFADGTDQKAQHLKDETQMLTDIQNNTLPAVTFWKPIGQYNEHPGYADLVDGDQHLADIIQKIQGSAMWKDTAIIVTYDENGGTWDHVAPPKVDKWGPGTRVPTIIISPYAKKGFVDHTSYDTTSILKFIENRYNLPALTDRDAKVNDLTNAFDFSQATGQGGTNGNGGNGNGSSNTAPGIPNSGQGGSNHNDSGSNGWIWILASAFLILASGGYLFKRRVRK